MSRCTWDVMCRLWRRYLDSGLELCGGFVRHGGCCFERGLGEEVVGGRKGEKGLCETDGVKPVAYVLDLLGGEEQPRFAVLERALVEGELQDL